MAKSDNKLVPIWLFDEVQRVIDELESFLETGDHIQPKTLRDWHGLMCALKYISPRGLTPSEEDYARLLAAQQEERDRG